MCSTEAHWESRVPSTSSVPYQNRSHTPPPGIRLQHYAKPRASARAARDKNPQDPAVIATTKPERQAPAAPSSKGPEDDLDCGRSQSK